MARNRKPRKAYRPGTVSLNAHEIAMAKVHKLIEVDARAQIELLRLALLAFKRGQDCMQHWRSLADCANVAETLAGLRIGCGPQADTVIQRAQQALSDVRHRQLARRTWTLRPGEIEALHWLIKLHELQLNACAYSEFERALDLTRERITQARAGNAPAGAVIVEGEIV